MTLKEYGAIRLRDDIRGTLGDEAAIAADPNRTEARDAAAKWLLEDVDLDNWDDVLMIDLKERSEWSRQHFSNNVIPHYFEGVGPRQDGDDGSQSAASDTPRDGPVTGDSSPLSASPGALEPADRPDLTAGEETLVCIVEDGTVTNVIDVPIPDHVDDLETYLQGVLVGVSGQS